MDHYSVVYLNQKALLQASIERAEKAARVKQAMSVRKPSRMSRLIGLYLMKLGRSLAGEPRLAESK